MGNVENLRPQWKPGQSGNPKGRPKNRVPDQLVETLKLKTRRELKAGLSRVEVDSWDEYMLNASSDGLTIIAQDAKIPIYARATARAIIIELKNGKTATLDKLRDRIFGTEAQKVELTGANGTDLIPAQRLTEEQARELMKKLDEEY